MAEPEPELHSLLLCLICPASGCRMCALLGDARVLVVDEGGAMVVEEEVDMAEWPV